MTLEPAKKPAPAKKERSPLKEKNDHNTFERVKSADAKRSSLLGEIVLKNKEHNEKAMNICQESQERYKKKIETITTTLTEKINRASKNKEENISKFKSSCTKKQEKFNTHKEQQMKEEEQKRQETVKETKERIRKAEEKREENKRQIKLNNELKEKKFLDNKEKNIKNTKQEDC